MGKGEEWKISERNIYKKILMKEELTKDFTKNDTNT